MPRVARVKSFDSIYHVMCRSISEIDLFKEEKDKEHYLSLMKGYQEVFAFKVYAYCLMNNHCHFIIDVNGADISKIFHGLNHRYALYFNKKYGRRGHLFQDRFKSIIVKDDQYLITLSGYIHANPFSISEYSDCVEQYKYSSLGIYMGIHEDKYELVDKAFVLNQFSNKGMDAHRLYLEFVKQCTDSNIKADVEFKNEGTRYISERKILPREYSVRTIIEFIVKKFNTSETTLRMKNSRKATKERAIFVLLMRCFCNYRLKDICEVIGNMTQSRVSKLCSIAMELVMEEYKGIVQEFIGTQTA
jgi:putative transposase